MSLLAIFESVENEETVHVDAEQAADEVTELAAENDNIVDATAEVEGETKVIEAGAADAEQLVNHGEVAEEALESGEGLSEDGAVQAIIAVEACLSRLYGSKAAARQYMARRVPARESFSTASGRIDATKFVIEQVGESVKKAWEALKAIAMRIWEKIKNIVLKIVGSLGGMEKQFVVMLKRIEGLKGKKPKNEKIKSGLAGQFYFNALGKQMNPSSVIEHAITLAKQLPAMAESRAKALSALTGAAGDVDLGQLQTKIGEVTDIVYKAMGSLPGQENSYGPFVAGFGLIAEEKSLKFKFKKLDGVKAEEEVSVLSEGELKSVVESAQVLVREAQNLKRLNETGKKVNDGVTKLINQVLKTLDHKDAEENFKKAAGDLRTACSDLITLGTSFELSGPAVVNRTIHSSYALVSQMVAQYRTDGGTK